MAYLLGTCNHIRVFEVAGNNISNEGANQLANKLHINRTLNILNLNDNQITDYGIEALSDALKRHPTLKELHISGNKLTQQGVSILNQLVQKIRLYKFFKPYTNYKRISRFKI